MDPRDHLIVAMDTASPEAAAAIADRLAGAARWFKVGSELYTAAGPAAVRAFTRRGRVFLDLKYHDIPAAVSGAVAAAARLGIAMCTVHAAGGTAMLRAAREAADRAVEGAGRERPRIIGVTLLTSDGPDVLHEVGLAGSPREVALRLAHLAREAGLDGVVASPLEVAGIRAACGPGFLIVCPGIRPGGTARDDQRRVGTPREAIAAGADFLVVGRPITRAGDPRAAFEEIVGQMAVP
ncbi:MAG TPA: orotidine-5'-phosphate decarboxylase [bacterium]|nr:orotidine-5'-phosphate decarboxylase [bacterium]